MYQAYIDFLFFIFKAECIFAARFNCCHLGACHFLAVLSNQRMHERPNAAWAIRFRYSNMIFP